MSITKILAFDFNSSSELGRGLNEILQSQPDLSPHLCKDWAGHDNSFKKETILAMISKYNPQLIFLLFSSKRLGEIKVLIKEIRNKHPNSIFIVIYKNGCPDEIVSLLESGVADFMTPPFKAVDVIARISRLKRQIHKSKLPTSMLKEKLGLKQLVGESLSFIEAAKKIPVIARSDFTVLITGETGTGKEMFARSIHYLSPRDDHPFVPVNCGAIPVELIENELFGHVQGAYTNATTFHEGLIHEAQKGTLFLDEIDCLPLSAQVKLLRFLQDKVYRNLGSSRMIRADVRLIAATNYNLHKAVKDGKFRSDLFFRLNIIPLTLPSLRERKEDIPALAEHFLFQYASELNRNIIGFTSQAMQKLMFYEWPGNIRELENVIKRALIFAQDKKIQADDIQLLLQETSFEQGPFKKAKTRTIDQFEKNYIRDLLAANQGNITKSAKKAGKNRRAFWELIRKHKIDVTPYRNMTF